MKKRNRKPRAKSGRPLPWIRPVFIMIFVVFLAFVAYHQAIRFLKTSEFFIVKDIALGPSVKDLKSRTLENLKGKNLLAVDLKMIQRDLQYQYPEISELKVSRRFPDQIYVSAYRRVAVAQLKVKNQTVVLDKYGVILPSSVGQGLQLPLLTGVETERWKPALGTRMRGKDLFIALQIINSFSEEPSLSSYQISRVDVGNFSEIFFFLSNNLKIIIDRDNIIPKIRLLSVVLSQMRPDLGDIKYVDLRFKDPVLGKNP